MNAGLLVACAIAAIIVAWILTDSVRRRRRRARHRARPLPEADRMVLRRRLPLYPRLPPAERTRLEGLIGVFLAEKEFVGCRGLVVTRPMRVLIAAQACLLVLGRDQHVYDELRSVLVYPSQFVVRDERHDADGVVTEEEQVLAGQSWDVSRIILSWEDVTARSGGDDAYNVVIHEFAHYLDHDAGGAPGAPAMTTGDEHERWAGVFQREFDALRAAVDRGEETFLDPYAAEDEAEFFAVASEAFFEAAVALRRRHPSLYDRLQAFYRLDPAGWA